MLKNFLQIKSLKKKMLQKILIIKKNKNQNNFIKN